MRSAIIVTAVLLALAPFWASAQTPPAPAPAPAPAPEAPPPVDIRQVQIQVWISETGDQGLRDLGANLQFRRQARGKETSGNVAEVRTNVFDPRAPAFTVSLPTPSPPINQPAVRATQTTPGRPAAPGNISWDNRRPDVSPEIPGLQTQSGVGLDFDIIDTDYGTLEGIFRAIEQKSDVDLISKPELLVQNTSTAEIHAGGEVPYQAIAYKDGRPQLNVTWRNIGVNLKLVPEVLSPDLIKVNIQNLDVSDIVRVDNIRGVDLPVFSTRSQTGPVVVPNGQMLVIGGLSSRIVRKSEQRVPLLGRIPILGIPFRGRHSDVSNTHLLVFLRPTIVDLRELRPEAIRALNFWREDKWQHMENIEEEVQTMNEGL